MTIKLRTENSPDVRRAAVAKERAGRSMRAPRSSDAFVDGAAMLDSPLFEDAVEVDPPRIHTLAHLSDLHLGRSADTERAARALCDQLLELNVDQVVITGDITHRGNHAEALAFERAFAPLLDQDRVTVVPGNHDRIGEDAGERWMDGLRVSTLSRPGLRLIRVDSTTPRNRSLFHSHGELCERVLAQLDDALAQVPRDTVCAILLHHHVLPMPEETFGERIAATFGWPHADELPLGHELLKLARGRCDLLLHGHRHVPNHFLLWAQTPRPLRIQNAGSSTELGGFSVFQHCQGMVLGAPQWVGRALNHRSAKLNPLPRAATILSQLQS